MQDTGAVVVTGASGLIGRALAARSEITPFARSASGPFAWDPANARVHDDGRPVSALIHLAGESIAPVGLGARWTAARKRSIVDSRVAGTRTLVDWLKDRAQKPRVFICANAIGYYGDRGDEVLDEESPAGRGFLADLCVDWQREAERAAELGIRVVILRIAPVLAADGGVLDPMLPLFRFGLGGPVGSGRQWFPWVHLEDVVGVIETALENDDMRGAYNVVAPEAVRQGAFAKQLGRALGRPALLPAPAFALRLALGEFADEALLASQRITPRRLEEAGYAFRFGELAPALADAVNG